LSARGQHAVGQIDPFGAATRVSTDELLEQQTGADGDLHHRLPIVHVRQIQAAGASAVLGQSRPGVIDEGDAAVDQSDLLA
jgi:hypothetical protein